MYIWCTYVVLGLGLSSLVHYLCHISCEPADTTHTHLQPVFTRLWTLIQSWLLEQQGRRLNVISGQLSSGMVNCVHACMRASSISTPQLLNALLPNASKSPASVFVCSLFLCSVCAFIHIAFMAYISGIGAAL